MGSTCQHCGAKLPQIADAFCPECRGALDEAPARPAAPGEPVGAAGDAGPPTSVSGWPTWLVGAAIGAVSGLLLAFFVLRGEELTGRAVGSVVARAVLGATALGALIGAASDWRR